MIRNFRCGLDNFGIRKKIGHTAIRQQFPEMISLIWETVPTRKSAMDVKLVVKHHGCHSSIIGAIVASWVPRLEHVPDDRGEPSEGAQLFVSSLHSRVID